MINSVEDRKLRDSLAFGAIYFVMVGIVIIVSALYAKELPETKGPYVELGLHTGGVLKVMLYVYNDKTQLWDRAREETVKNITCDKLRGMGLPSVDEYYIEKGE